MSTHRTKLSNKKRKARPGGCITIAAQHARIARKKAGSGAGSPSASGIVADVLFSHGGLAAIMVASQILGALLTAGVAALFGMITALGRSAPTAFQGVRNAGPATEPVVFIPAVGATLPRQSRESSLKLSSGGGSGGKAPRSSGEAQKATPEVSPGYSLRGKAHMEARAEAEKRFGNSYIYEYVAQKLDYDLEPPISKQVKGLHTALDKGCPEVYRLLSRETNSASSDSFRIAKKLYNHWKKANPQYTDATAARAIFGDLVELQRAVEEAARRDPTQGPKVIGPENDGDEGGVGARVKTQVEPEPPAPSPFKL